MRKNIVINTLIILILTCFELSIQGQQGVFKFNEGWQFKLSQSNHPDSQKFDNIEWQPVQLPHDWSIGLNFDEFSPSGNRGACLRGGCGLYRKFFSIEKSDSNKNIFIDFDGIYMNSTVWINGHKLGTRPIGYISFRYDLTPYIKPDSRNELLVKVENQQPNSRWYSGSGIYRNVWLVKTGKIYIEKWGTYITTKELGKNLAKINIQTKIHSNQEGATDYLLKTSLYDNQGNQLKTFYNKSKITTNATDTINQEIRIDNPNLWSFDSPYLYKAISEIYYKNIKVHEYQTIFGLRDFYFDKDSGFFLNNKPTKIIGVCMHHDLGALGSAINYRALERQLELLKVMGINGIRTSHNPPAPELLQLCDKMGFIVMDETFDVWRIVKENTPYNYNLYFDEWHRKDITDHVLRDRNHPSVFIWSIGNEIPEQWGNVNDSSGRSIARELVKIVHSLDSRPVTSGLNMVSPENNIYKSNALDLMGINYHHKEYPNLPNIFPNQKFILTESNSALQTRGEYLMPSNEIRRWAGFTKENMGGTPDLICSAYDNSSAPWASTYEEVLKPFLKYPYLSGFYAWTGFDYLGEPTPYPFPARSSYFGILDIAGFPKDAFYLFQSLFTKDTVLHVFPHWNWKVGQSIDVWAYYNNADSVELFLNSISLGTRSKKNDDLHVQWPVIFEAGCLKVISYNSGRIIAEKVSNTAGPPTKILLTPDRKQINADGEDLCFVKVTITDKDGNLVPNANNLLRFSISGDAEIIGLDNGLQTDLTSYSNKNSRRAFNGLALVIIKAHKKKSKIILYVSGEGLEKNKTAITLN